jgi:hypothetical protein
MLEYGNFGWWVVWGYVQLNLTTFIGNLVINWKVKVLTHKIIGNSELTNINSKVQVWPQFVVNQFRNKRVEAFQMIVWILLYTSSVWNREITCCHGKRERIFWLLASHRAATIKYLKCHMLETQNWNSWTIPPSSWNSWTVEYSKTCPQRNRWLQD